MRVVAVGSKLKVYYCCKDKCMGYVPGNGYSKEQKAKDMAYLKSQCLNARNKSAK